MNNYDEKIISINNNDSEYEDIKFFNFDLKISNYNNNQIESNNNIITYDDNSKCILINFNYMNKDNFYNPISKNYNNNISIEELINQISNILNDNKSIIINLDTFITDILNSFKNVENINKQLELDFSRAWYFINYNKIHELEQMKYYFEYKISKSNYISYNKYNILEIICSLHTQAVIGPIYEYLYKILKNLDIHIVEISDKTHHTGLSFYTNIYNNIIYINVTKRMKLISFNYRNNHIDLGEIKIDINFSFHLNDINFINNEYVYFNITYIKN